MFKPGDKIIVATSLDRLSDLHEETITKVSKDTVQCGSSENQYYTAFTWPVAYKSQLEEIVQKRAELKKAFDDSMGLVYELKNKIARETK